jgi:5-methylcytosine-specific restriction endonuclease McrA
VNRPSAQFQLDFLSKVQRLFDEGEFSATYKFALLAALVELAVEKGDDSDSPLELSITDIAAKFIEFYWPQVMPYREDGVLLQNNGKQADIPNRVLRIRSSFGSLAQFRSSKEWLTELREVGNIIKKMPLWKLQTLRGEKMIFLYEEKLSLNNHITLLHGAAYCLRQFNSFLLQLSHSTWIEHIRRNPRNKDLVGNGHDLEKFLFGTQRSSLEGIRGTLLEIQQGQCFYCGKRILKSGEVDHFIPWVKYQRDISENFVLADESCNKSKSDMLASVRHLGHWRERNTKHEITLAGINIGSILSDSKTILGVARYAYHHAYNSGSQVWDSGKSTMSLSPDFENILT